LQNSCRQTRKEASQSITKVFDENHKIFTFITNILAKDKLETVMAGREYKIEKEMEGRELAGLENEPLFDFYIKLEF
jgi:hypothetical protein